MIGLAVLLIGGSAIALGMFISQGAVDSSVVSTRSEESARSPKPSDEPTDEQTAEGSAPSRDEPTPPEEAPAPSPPATEPVVTAESKQVTLGGTSTGQIDVYEQPSFSAAAPSYGVPGDRVLATGETVRAETGLVWYRVRFDSGIEGWIPESNIISNSPAPSVSQPPTPTDILSSAPKFTTLSGAADERIDVRSSPSTTAGSPHYGLGGDPVQILDAVRGNDGYNWYRVAFESGAEGWVREDFIRL